MTRKDKIHVLSRAVIVNQGHILLCKTLDLPKAFYFLPGGHIEHGESAKEAVLRELQEEAGVKECTIKRSLGCLEYSFEPGHSRICHNHEYNFVFEATSPSLKKQIPIARLEDHIELFWFPLDHLFIIDFRPEPLQDLLKKWLDGPSLQNLESVMI